MADRRRITRGRAASGALAVMLLAAPRFGPFDAATNRSAATATAPTPRATDLQQAQRVGGAVTAEASDVATAYRILQLVNDARSANGLPALVLDARLVDAAARHAADQADRQTMTHFGGDQSSAGGRITAAGVTTAWWGENVAYGYGTAEGVVDAWMDSTGHREMVLSPHAETMGVAMRRAVNGVPYWSQTFAGSW